MYPQPQIKLKTEKGLKYFFWGLLLFVIWQLLMIPLLASMQPALEDLQEAEDPNDEEAIEGFLPFMGPLCGIMILLAIYIIFILLGLVFIYNGRAEFGEKQKEATTKGLVVLIIGFIIGLAGSLVSGGLQQVSDELVIIGYIPSIITSIFYGLGFIFLLKFLLDEQGNYFLKIGALLLIIISILNLIFVAMAISLDNGSNVFADNSLIIGLGFSLFMVVPWAIFAFSFYRALKRVQWGAVRPIVQPIQYFQPPGMPMGSGMGAPPPPPVPGPVMGPGDHPQPSPPPIPMAPKKCPSCDYMLQGRYAECPKCGYYFGNE